MGIAGVDTRAITRRLRVTGCLNGAITTDPSISGAQAGCDDRCSLQGAARRGCCQRRCRRPRCLGSCCRSKLASTPASCLPAVLRRRGAAAALQVVDDCGQGPDQGGATGVLRFNNCTTSEPACGMCDGARRWPACQPSLPCSLCAGLHRLPYVGQWLVATSLLCGPRVVDMRLVLCPPLQVTCKEPYEWKDATEEEWEFAKAGEQRAALLALLSNGPLGPIPRLAACVHLLGGAAKAGEPLVHCPCRGCVPASGDLPSAAWTRTPPLVARWLPPNQAP